MKRLIVTALVVVLTTAAMASVRPAHRHIHRARPIRHHAHRYSDAYSDDMINAVTSAAENGNVYQLRALFAKGAPANYLLENGLSPLEVAVDGAHVDAVRFLIAHGANINAEDNGGNTALDSAEGRRKFSTDPVERTKLSTIIAVLIKAGAEAQDKAVLKAAGDGDVARLQKLVADHARVAFSLGNPLVLAAEGAHVRAVRVLLKTGERGLYYPDSNGATALDIAELRQKQASDPTMRAKYAQIITLLKKAGVLEASQRAVLSAVNDDDVARLGLLFAHGATANFVDDERVSPLMDAAEGGDVEATRFLLAHGANVHAEDNTGRTSLDIAQFCDKDRSDPKQHVKYTEIITLLLKAGAKAGGHERKR